jgi:3-phenylpropionate/trans-cinnamate dioxygenase ferredoxin subunit
MMVGRFIKIGRATDIGEGEIKMFKSGDLNMLLTCHNGEIFALDNVCSHDGAPLGEGILVDGQIECPRHGARFDIKTGSATRMPAIAGINSYEIKIENGDILVEDPD